MLLVVLPTKRSQARSFDVPHSCLLSAIRECSRQRRNPPPTCSWNLAYLCELCLLLGRVSPNWSPPLLARRLPHATVAARPDHTRPPPPRPAAAITTRPAPARRRWRMPCSLSLRDLLEAGVGAGMRTRPCPRVCGRGRAPARPRATAAHNRGGGGGMRCDGDRTQGGAAAPAIGGRRCCGAGPIVAG